MGREATAPQHADRLRFSSPVIDVGDFRCDAAHPLFAAAVPTTGYCFVFPRNPLWIQHDGRRPFVADANVVPLYNPGHPFRRSRITGDGARTDWFSISPAVLRQMLRPLDARAADAATRLFRFDFGRVSARTFLKQRAVLAHVSRSKAPDVLFVEETAIAVLDDILSHLYGKAPRPVTSRAHRVLAEDTRACLGQTFASPMGLSDLARALDTSVFHLCRVFRHCTGSTIHGYRNELRLRRSLDLLDESAGDILSIALALGYSGHSHFTGVFRRAFGLTPSSYRDATRTTRGRLLEQARS